MVFLKEKEFFPAHIKIKQKILSYKDIFSHIFPHKFDMLVFGMFNTCSYNNNFF